MAEYSVIGKRLPRVDARVKVTGQAKYAADLELANMLWGKILRSPYPHARILNIDASRAEKLFGVKAIVTGRDFGGYLQQYRHYAREEPPLAVDKVVHQAEGVAAVAAVSEDIAEEACELIKVDYEELPAVFDPEEAMKKGAPQIHNHARNNISVEYHWHFGDVEGGFAESYLVREDRFRTGRVTHGYIEPPAVLACYDPSGYITIWPAKQSPHRLWLPIAECFQLPLSKVRLIQPFIGGGFGGTKNAPLAGDFCAILLSKKTGKPVKIVYSQEEELVTSRRRHPVIIDIKTGVNKDGTLVATKVQVIADGGAYVFQSPISMYLAGGLMTLPYKLPNFKYDAYCPYTNNPVSGAMRGHGASHTRFAAEIQMDMIAEELGMDPVEIRLRNAIKAPHETINKLTVKSCGLIEAIEKVAADPIWMQRKKRSIREGAISKGTGFSSVAYLGGARGAGHQACAAFVRICEDGTVNLLTGATDAGQGSDTVLCQIVAEELGVALEDIEIKRVDSAYTPVDPGTWGSRVAIIAGNATKIAAADAKRQLLEIAAKHLGVRKDQVEIKDRKVFVKWDPDKSMTFSSLVRIASYSGTGTVILGRGSFTNEAESPDFDKGIGNNAVSYSFTAQSAEVEVDMETGRIRCTNSVIAHDAGRVLNPMIVEGQIEGAAMQGLGQALYEDFIMDRGKTLNPTFLDYKMPLSTDIPNIKLIDIESDDPDGPFGAKEAGEGSIVSAPPAIVSAIRAATGIWFKELPVTPEKVIKALNETGRGNPPEEN